MINFAVNPFKRSSCGISVEEYYKLGFTSSFCSLKGTDLCPCKGTCDGVNNRQCDTWQGHSSR